MAGASDESAGAERQLLPLFPLGSVLFPGLVLPLHVFEPRYRTLVRDLTAEATADATPEFGVVAIRRGWEVAITGAASGDNAGGDPTADSGAPPDGTLTVGSSLTLYEVGCTAEVRKLTELPDGRYDLVTVGRRRFRVLRVATGDTPYLVAEVEWLPEETGEPDRADELAGSVLAGFQEYLQLVRRDSGAPGEQLPGDPTVLSHLVAATASLTLDDRQRLLAAPDTVTRLRAERVLLRREVALLRRIRAVPVPLSDLAVPASPN